ncbi:hypothetical protein XdyCFBP7245_13870 [Xanthomonas dyei]|uniref:Uncharacterized protein n=2 Tax=Xanthomonas dyei TaxID=743699 RepID=A0A2S7C1A7_9XANT|nr:hypothetical protein XdyCFBP7245_13870 [Xanthomonas dyei]
MQLVSRLREINKNIENAEFSNALADLGLELAKLKSELASVVEENTNLKTRLAVKQSTPTLEFKNGAYFKQDGEGPFCSGCYDNSSKTIRLVPVSKTLEDLASHMCPVCQSTYGGSGV